MDSRTACFMSLTAAPARARSFRLPHPRPSQKRYSGAVVTARAEAYCRAEEAAARAKGLKAGMMTARTAPKDTVTRIASACVSCLCFFFVYPVVFVLPGHGVKRTHYQYLPLEGYGPEGHDLVGYRPRVVARARGRVFARELDSVHAEEAAHERQWQLVCSLA